jgi:hypothetical protein
MAWSLFDQTAVSPISWAQSELASLGVPLTAVNEQSLIAWALREGGGGTYNPLNTSQPEPGSTTFNSSGVQDYPSWDTGIEGTTATIEQSAYTQIYADLQAGTGIGATSELGTWSGGAYDSLASTWGEAGQYLNGQSTPLPSGTSGSSGSGTQQATLASFNPLNPSTWVPSILGSVIGSSGIEDALERGALIVFGAILVIIGIIRLTGGSNQKITLNMPVSSGGSSSGGSSSDGSGDSDDSDDSDDSGSDETEPEPEHERVARENKRKSAVLGNVKASRGVTADETLATAAA